METLRAVEITGTNVVNGSDVCQTATEYYVNVAYPESLYTTPGIELPPECKSCPLYARPFTKSGGTQCIGPDPDDEIKKGDNYIYPATVTVYDSNTNPKEGKCGIAVKDKEVKVE